MLRLGNEPQRTCRSEAPEKQADLSQRKAQPGDREVKLKREHAQQQSWAKGSPQLKKLDHNT